MSVAATPVSMEPVVMTDSHPTTVNVCPDIEVSYTVSASDINSHPSLGWLSDGKSLLVNSRSTSIQMLTLLPADHDKSRF